MKTIIKTIVRKICPIRGKGNKFIGISSIFIRGGLQVRGNNNTIECYSKNIGSLKIFIYGNDNHIIIRKDTIFKSGKIWIEDCGNTIEISERTTIEGAELAVAENGHRIFIGRDCMLSSDIRIATTDSHSIIEKESGKRINDAKDVIIEDHVWLGNSVKVNKGVVIQKGTIIAGNSVVTKSCNANCIYAGVPATLKKENVDWLRERI